MLLRYSKNREGVTLRLKPFFCILFTLLVSLQNIHAQLACIQEINVSLDHNCESTITADELLSDYDAGSMYEVMLMDAHGAVIMGNALTDDHLDTRVRGKVSLGANSCWSWIHVEDKLAPVITCRDTIIDCFDTVTLLPSVVDACGTSHAELVNQSIVPLECVDTLIKEHRFYYQGVDDRGNTSSVCMQTVRYRRVNLDDIVFPQSFELDEMTNLSCRDVVFDSLGFPSPESTGYPLLDTIRLKDNEATFCNIGLTKEDFFVSEIGCTRKYMRTWTVYEWWCNTTIDTVYVQTIEISDTESPVVMPPADAVVPAGTSSSCEALYTIPLPTVSDDCTGILEIDISYDGGFINNVSEPQEVVLPAGENTIRYLVYDNCENLVDTFYRVTVMDQSNPTAVCDNRVVVSLRSDGTAKAWSETFDEGSFDNCGSIYKSLIKRLDNNCGSQIPEFIDMTYLGHIDNSRFYYLSQWKVTGTNAIAFSEGFGGMAVTFESAAEANWVHAQVSEHIDEPYYIGLSDADHDGTFLWPDHRSLNFTRWAMGEPNNIGDHVVVNANGEWSVENGATRHYYVYETADPYGYSDAVSFCCEDAGEEIMVGFRVIDEFGSVSGDCMVRVEVQDKVAPVITCPADRTLECGTQIDFNNLQIYGVSSASDVCSVTIDSTYADSLNTCGIGDIIRTWNASDANGTTTCTQTISLRLMGTTTESMIVWPEDFETDDGCNANLDPSVTGMPDVSGGSCTDLQVQPHSDETYVFANSGDGCLKILREWVVVDLCMHGMTGYNPDTFYQAIKINDFEDPVIEASTLSDCSDVTINIDDCMSTDVTIDVRASDNCASDTEIRSRVTYDELSDGTTDDTQDFANNRVDYTMTMPLGVHTALCEFFDGCGNKASCTKQITVQNTAPPSAVCVGGLTVPLQEMDLDGDGDTDVIMATIRAEMLDAENSSTGQSGSSHPCGSTIHFSFSTDTSNTVMNFDCNDIGTNNVSLVVTATNGLQSMCNTTVEVTDVEDNCSEFNAIEVENCIDFNYFVEPCNEMVEFNIEASSPDCPIADDITYSYEIDFFSDGTIDRVGEGATAEFSFMEDNVGVGNHTLSMIFHDACGRIQTCSSTVNFKLPKRDNFCNEAFNVFLSEDGELIMELDDFLNDDYDNCGDDLTTYGLSSDFVLTQVALDCTIGHQTEIPVYRRSSDGTVSSCTSLVSIRNPEVCGDSRFGFCFQGFFPTDPCGPINISVNLSVRPDCGNPSSLRHTREAKIDYHSDGIYEVIYEDELTSSEQFFHIFDEIGCHTIEVSYLDQCGNTDRCIQIFDIYPVPDYRDPEFDHCAPEVFVNLNDGEREAYIEDFLSIAYSQCNSSMFGFDPDLTQQYKTFDCSYYPEAQVPIYGIDPLGNRFECDALVRIWDDDMACEGSGNNISQTISGNIATELNEPVQEVEVELQGSPFDMEYTTEDGDYAFPSMPVGGNYTISPYKDDNPLNGVSTLDLVMIQNHILGISTLDSPYKLIAADVDNSGNITATDLIELRKLILGVYQDFPNNTSWRMVDADHHFVDPADPFSYAFPEEHDVRYFDRSMSIDFVGVKTGDVNNSVVTNFSQEDIETRLAEQRGIVITDKVLNAYEMEAVVLDLSALEGVTGFQYAVELDGVDFVDISSDLPNFGTKNYNYLADLGVLNISWNGEEMSGAETIELVIITNKSRTISESVRLGHKMRPEMYVDNNAIDLTIIMDGHTAVETGVKLYQNEPNPWSQFTDIHYSLPYDQDVEIIFYNMNGQLLYKEIKSGNKGLNTSRIDYTQLNGSGIIYYELITESERLREKMLLIRR